MEHSLARVDSSPQNNYEHLSHIVFDAYGTLLTPSKFNIWNKLGKYTHAQRHEILHLLKQAETFDELFDHIPLKRPKLQKLIQEKMQKDIDAIQPYPEVLCLLELLSKHYTLTIDSHLVPLYAEPIRRYFSPYIKHCILSFEQQHIKGEKQHYLDLIKELGVPAEQILFVGDHYRKDYLGPKSVGMHALHIKRTGAQAPEEISTPAELLKILRVPNQETLPLN